MIVKIFYTILLIWVWYGIIRYRKQVHSWTWNWYWAEKYLWSGWTYVALTLFWLFLIFLWAMYPFWWLELISWKK